MKKYKCRTCKESKTSDMFYKDKNKTYRDGLSSTCKECDRLNYRIRRKRKPNSYLKKDKTYYQKHREEISIKRKEWYQKNKHKITAHEKVKRALYKGILVRKPCEECGDNKSEAHHEDYTKPLDVIWLCRAHHMRKHAK